MARRAHKHPLGLKKGAVNRAAFQPDSPPELDNSQAVWQHSPWQSQDSWQIHPAQAQHAEDPWDADFSASNQDWVFEPIAQEPAYQDPAYQEPMLYPGQQEMQPGFMAQQPIKTKRFPFISLGVIIVSLAVIGVCIFNVQKAQSHQAAFIKKANEMRRQAFFDNIMIDELAVAGMTPAQLRQSSAHEQAAMNPNINIQLTIDNTLFQFNSSHIPFERNLEEAMEQAWTIGRQNSPAIINSQWTPFEARWRQVQHTKNIGAYFSTQVSFSGKLIDQLADSLMEQINTHPVNAVVSSFDFETKQFTVTQDVTGRKIEAQAISNALKNALQNKDYQAAIKLQSTPVLPQVTSSDLRNRFSKLATFSTKTGSNNDRNTNIALAAQAISNRTLMPGETFSFNETTGKRTSEKGYRGAPAIYGGVLIDDVGGGVCQVSSTLFNAAAGAGMSIVDRSPHAWPVSYLEKGLDAAVNWPNLDFKFRNDNATPVFIIAHYAKNTLTIEIYGLMSGPGESITLETQLISTQKPPSEPVYQQNPELAPGTQKELKQARTGYVVDTYRVYLRNGQEYKREKLFTSKYRMIQKVIEYN
ncbi:MAG: hypothetical protein GXZ04_03040 [Clostridiales bacterium]|nr:hypothetical protein [Clostridiales bacterium]